MRRLILTEAEQQAVARASGDAELRGVLAKLADALIVDLRFRPGDSAEMMGHKLENIGETVNFFLGMFLPVREAAVVLGQPGPTLVRQRQPQPQYDYDRPTWPILRDD